MTIRSNSFSLSESFGRAHATGSILNGSDMNLESKRKRFVTFAWITLAFTIGVILWGAFVRATGSGAGCGSHWPTCNGQVIPRPEQIETVIEFTHRITSAVSGLLVLIMLVWAWRIFPKGHMARRGAALSLFFMITEGLVGAGLVLFELVAHNASAARALAAAAHLVNTFLLVTFITLTIHWASGGKPVRLRNQGSVGWMLALAYAVMLLLSASGAIAALGNTIFPSATLIAGMRQDFSPTAHFLIRLRVWHPVIAVGLGVYLLVIGSIIKQMRPSAGVARAVRLVQIVFLVQLAVGVVNLLLLAPVAMQLIHLLLADLVLIALVLLSANALAVDAPTAETQAAVAPAGD